MSQKITAKNLQYDSNLPPFLARLRGQHASERDSNAPDPILAARRRPGKQRSGSAEAEDAPLVVDEHGNSVDVTVGIDGSVKEKESTLAGAGEKEQQDQPAETDAASGEKIAAIGDQRKKRKIGKVIGADADDEDAQEHNSKAGKRGNEKTKNITTTPDIKEKDDAAAAAKAKTKKKAKKIKLSFGDDEG
ncbi:hypothetical protein NEMBOFW57_000080 [Staphylotrichum longicolle]|uniref:DUF4604 domain-containing protein n=1 Tax=Staphylotrichum longicolle TaxID=669026 RepID=A0AAD4I0L0_9PEZI|nr:hypothetical protein NEMBOFW57_000080 [Staphylotrichum longicolle]